MTVDAELLKLLACPDAHHAPLREVAEGTVSGLDGRALQCIECELIFPIRDGIPVLLLDEALRPS
ncbi:hypothetical protein CLV47_12063 [Antricoccus suffuscus]|uniref:Uncharacterized protein n=1 Tax=Antricoccus suffuscus TaxID=1629062 RepID=A0A2T0ZQG7_9ACTN|nr:Trm112 family protein [Antricoccus suffuscus]PRZ38596.1 hypothetical protein CLV47_12063 [Antricoccus suffuscus]